MFKLISIGIVFYLIYKFVFELVLPVSKATSQMKNQFREMHEQQQRNQQQQSQQQQAPPHQAQQKPVNKGDYIDFEEIQ